jgi:flavin-dependent dehydrogenase
VIPAAYLASEYDVIVVGARPAGAGTALLLAREGRRVLVVERGQYGTDTTSTHALMRAGVMQLARWGVLPAIDAAGTPPVRSATFVYGDDAMTVPVKPRDGVAALYAPKRTVLDRAIVDMATAVGVHVAYGTRLSDVLRRQDGRVIGAVLRADSGHVLCVRARWVVGADGLRSTVAQLVDAPVTRAGAASTANVFGYWSGVPVDGYRWYYRPGLSAGAIPTNDGQTCIFASVPTSRFSTVFRGNVDHGYRQVLDEVAPDLMGPLARASRVGTLRGVAGVPAFLRRAAGPGWALVGDAAYFKDPITAHGITDALVEAEHLARAILTGTDAALDTYVVDRDRRVAGVFDVTERIAAFDWTLEDARVLHKQLARAMADEVTDLEAFTREGAAA